MEGKTYKEYLRWFKKQFNSHPTETYLMVNVIDELIAMRNEYQKPDILDHVEPETVERVLDKLKIITFDEYRNSLNIK